MSVSPSSELDHIAIRLDVFSPVVIGPTLLLESSPSPISPPDTFYFHLCSLMFRLDCLVQIYSIGVAQIRVLVRRVLELLKPERYVIGRPGVKDEGGIGICCACTWKIE